MPRHGLTEIPIELLARRPQEELHAAGLQTVQVYCVAKGYANELVQHALVAWVDAGERARANIGFKVLPELVCCDSDFCALQRRVVHAPRAALPLHLLRLSRRRGVRVWNVPHLI